MKIKLFVISIFSLSSSLLAFQAGDVVPCDNTALAMNVPGYGCVNGQHTITQEEIDSDARNREQYEQSSAMWGKALSGGCDPYPAMSNCGLCYLSEGVLYPYKGAKNLWGKKYKFYGGATASRMRGRSELAFGGFYSAGEGPYSNEIMGCGKNPIFASLNDPVASCDRTAQDIVEWEAWKVRNPVGPLPYCRGGGESQKCYVNVNGKETEISRETVNALQLKLRTLYVFRSWEEMYNSGKLSDSAAAPTGAARDSGEKSAVKAGASQSEGENAVKLGMGGSQNSFSHDITGMPVSPSAVKGEEGGEAYSPTGGRAAGDAGKTTGKKNRDR